MRLTTTGFVSEYIGSTAETAVANPITAASDKRIEMK
jgi:hypothetical protein